MKDYIGNMLSFTLRVSFWVKDIFRGKEILVHYKNISLIQKDREKGEKYRAHMLQEILNHAVLHSEFYKGIDPSSLKNFPIVNKSILIENSDRVSVDLTYLPWQKGDLYIQKTSGSTGTPFSVPQDTRKRNRRLAELKYFGDTPHSN